VAERLREEEGAVRAPTLAQPPLPEFGVPQHFGIFFAMGFALVMESLFSAFYHVCPSDQNFQFVIGSLIFFPPKQTSD